MRTDQLEYLEEIARVNSMNKASKNLCISVQALSASMKNLEDELGFQILDTTHKGTRLTEKGNVFLEAGQTFLKKIYELQEDLLKEDLVSGVIPFYCMPGVVDVVLPDFLMSFQALNPNADIEARPIEPQDILDGLLEEAFDYIFVFSPMMDGKSLINWEERFEFVPLTQMRYYCAVNKELYLATQKSTSINAMLEYDIIFLEPYNNKLFSAAREIFKQYAPEKKIRSVRYKSVFDKMQSSQPVVSLSLTLCGRFENENNVVHIPITDKNIWINFGYVKLKGNSLSKQSQIMVHMMENFLHMI